MMHSNETNSVVKGALLLTVAGLISKVLSAGYRVPLQNITGDLGFYIYQQVYPILGIILIVSLYGFPSAISKITVELRSEGKSTSLRSFYIPVLLVLFSISSVFFLMLYLSAPFISGWIGDERLTRAFELAAYPLLLLPITSLLRGVFQGSSEMKPTAYSQVGEQFVRVGSIIFVAYLFAIQKIDVYDIGQAASIASMLGALIAISILSVFFFKRKPVTRQTFVIPWRYYLKVIFTLGIVASLNHMVLLIIQFADVFTLVPSLIKYGLSSHEAMLAKGIFDRGQPLIQLGTVLGSSFALALIPTLSKQKLQTDPKQYKQAIRSAMLLCFYLSAGAVIGLMILFPEVNLLLFKDMKGTLSLQILSIAMILSSISITVSSILQGLGYFKRTALFIMVAFSVKWVGNLLLVPLWGITGSSIATIISLFLLCIGVCRELSRRLPELHLLRGFNLGPFLKASIGMVVYLFAVGFIIPATLIPSRLGLLVYIIGIVLTGAFIYLLVLLRSGAFTERELSMLPFSSVFIKIYQGRDRFEK